MSSSSGGRLFAFGRRELLKIRNPSFVVEKLKFNFLPALPAVMHVQHYGPFGLPKASMTRSEALLNSEKCMTVLIMVRLVCM